MNGGKLPLSGENGILRGNERLGTDEETCQILAEMGPELERIYRASRLLDVRCFKLANLRIADFDRRQGTLAIGNEAIIVSDELRVVLSHATGNRTDGDLFLTPKGKRWLPNRLNKSFAKVKRQLSIEKDGQRVLL